MKENSEKEGKIKALTGIVCANLVTGMYITMPMIKRMTPTRDPAIDIHSAGEV
jgi:hypothetical protein